MKLTLDHTQRLNLHALMGAQRGTVDDMRLWWRLQDQIDLSEEERKQINWRIGKVGEMEAPMWDTTKSLKPKPYEFTSEEFKRVEKVVREWQPGFLASGDRRWLEPLLAQLDSASAPKVINGASTEAAVPARHRT